MIIMAQQSRRRLFGRSVVSVLLGIVLVPLATAAEPLRAQYTGKLLLVVEGPADEVGRATANLAVTRSALGAGAAPNILFDTGVNLNDACPDRAELTSPYARIRRVLELPTTPSPELRAGPITPGQAWNEAYARIGAAVAGAPPRDADAIKALSAGNLRLAVVEPDLVWIDEELDTTGAPQSFLSASGGTHRISAAADKHWPVRGPLDWHLQAGQLEAARRLVEERLSPQSERVTIAHFDTGFTTCEDKGLPPRLQRQRSWDFTHLQCAEGGQCIPSSGATDRPGSGLLNSHGHGTGTLGILAGGPVQIEADGRPVFAGPLGGAPFADIVEYRLSESVVIWHPSVVASALRWAADHDIDVISMSMGGPPNFSLHEAVNEAYCHGVAIFAAAGNNLRTALLWLSTPRTTVFPARYRRVIAVAGITADELTYSRRPWRWEYIWKPRQLLMQGNLGPNWVMDETLVAWTPNVLWLGFREEGQCDSPAYVRLNGAGTSAATPQVAAAAAQWLQYYRDEDFLRSKWRSWEKAEAVYRALLDTADRDTPDPDYNKHWFGRGIVCAAKAIADGIPAKIKLRPRARLGFDWIVSVLVGGGPGRLLSDKGVSTVALQNMLATEISQLTLTSDKIAEVLGDVDPDTVIDDAAVRRRALERLAAEPAASQTLRRLAHDQLAAGG